MFVARPSDSGNIDEAVGLCGMSGIGRDSSAPSGSGVSGSVFSGGKELPETIREEGRGERGGIWRGVGCGGMSVSERKYRARRVGFHMCGAKDGTGDIGLDIWVEIERSSSPCKASSVMCRTGPSSPSSSSWFVAERRVLMRRNLFIRGLVWTYFR